MRQSYKNHLMKRKDLTVVSFKLLEDKKINHIYFRFKEKILPFIGKEKFAIAVSGGSDSAIADCVESLSGGQCLFYIQGKIEPRKLVERESYFASYEPNPT